MGGFPCAVHKVETEGGGIGVVESRHEQHRVGEEMGDTSMTMHAHTLAMFLGCRTPCNGRST